MDHWEMEPLHTLLMWSFFVCQVWSKLVLVLPRIRWSKLLKKSSVNFHFQRTFWPSWVGFSQLFMVLAQCVWLILDFKPLRQNSTVLHLRSSDLWGRTPKSACRAFVGVHRHLGTGHSPCPSKVNVSFIPLLWDEILGTFQPNQDLRGIHAWYANAKNAHKFLRTEKIAVVPEIQPFLWWPIFRCWRGNFQRT